MLMYAIGRLLALQDGSFAARSIDYPGCEGRARDRWSARQQFRRVLAERSMR